MQPDEYGICVVSGNESHRGPVFVDAYVYQWGGRQVARFSASTKSQTTVREEREQTAAARDQVRREAEAWVADQA